MLPRMTMNEVDFKTFVARHGAALEAEPVQNFALLMPIHRMGEDDEAQESACFWSFGNSSACSLLHNGTLVIGNVSQADCRLLTEITDGHQIRRLRCPQTLIESAIRTLNEKGIKFSEPMPQITMELTQKPYEQSTSAKPRTAIESDVETVTNWFGAFQAEALPDMPPLPHRFLETRARNLIRDKALAVLEDAGEKVSMAAIVTKLPFCEAMSMVYTPPEQRNHGYAGSVVAYVSKQVIEKGKPACLYVNARNPVSTRCYEKLGYLPVTFHAEAVRT